jgi:hypothetical protein
VTCNPPQIVGVNLLYHTTFRQGPTWLVGREHGEALEAIPKTPRQCSHCGLAVGGFRSIYPRRDSSVPKLKAGAEWLDATRGLVRTNCEYCGNRGPWFSCNTQCSNGRLFLAGICSQETEITKHFSLRGLIIQRDTIGPSRAESGRG